MKKRKDGRYRTSTVINGKRVYFYGSTPREVIKKQDEYLKGINTSPTVQDVADMWACEWDNLAYGTLCGYKVAYKRIVAYFGSERVYDIKPSHINNFLTILINQGFSRQTINIHLIALRRMFKIACVERYIETSPVEYISLPRHLPKGKRELPSDKDIQKIKDNVNIPFGLFPYLILYTGLRRGEALALNKADLDFNNKLISINKKIVHTPNQAVLEDFTKTNAGMRKVIIPEALSNNLKVIKTKILFPNDKGSYLSLTEFRHRWNNYVKITGISCTPHQIRHAYATILYEAGIGDKDTQELLGHASITTTRDIYQSIREIKMVDTQNKLDNYLRGQ